MDLNILILGPSGSGKGTQGAVIQKRFRIQHVETGVIFRDNIKRDTELGKKSKEYIDMGELVPDDITIPMILSRLKEADCISGWLLDGFPRNLVQAAALWEVLQKEGIKLDYVIEIVLDKDISKKRIMGRRFCAIDNNHPNNIYFDAIKPKEKNGKPVCHICGCESLTIRAEDQDEVAIDKRHSIYYDNEKGTIAAINYFETKVKVVRVESHTGFKETSENLMKMLS